MDVLDIVSILISELTGNVAFSLTDASVNSILKETLGFKGVTVCNIRFHQGFFSGRIINIPVIKRIYIKLSLEGISIDSTMVSIKLKPMNHRCKFKLAQFCAKLMRFHIVGKRYFELRIDKQWQQAISDFPNELKMKLNQINIQHKITEGSINLIIAIN